MYRPYSNSKILAAGILSFLCAATMLVLFIVFVSSSRPSFGELSKFTFVTLCIAFFLFVTYGVCALIKDDDIQTYGVKTTAYSLILFATVLILGIIGLVKSKSRVLPTVTLSMAIAVAAIVFFVNLQFFLADVRLRNFPRSPRRLIGRERSWNELHCCIRDREQGK